MTEKRTKEAVRYLGYGRHAVDATTLAMIESSFKELEVCADKRSVYRIFECILKDDGKLQIGKMIIDSESLRRNLTGCSAAAVLGVTLGVQADMLMKKYTLTNIARAVVLQACGAALMEEYCDECQEKIGEQVSKDGLWMRPRFSPGYGDFDIRHQEDILRMLDTAKKIGLTMTDSYMLTPTKSVTALIGLSPVKTDCHRQGCEVCGKKGCVYRRDKRGVEE